MTSPDPWTFNAPSFYDFKYESDDEDEHALNADGFFGTPRRSSIFERRTSKRRVSFGEGNENSATSANIMVPQVNPKAEKKSEVHAPSIPEESTESDEKEPEEPLSDLIESLNISDNETRVDTSLVSETAPASPVERETNPEHALEIEDSVVANTPEYGNEVECNQELVEEEQVVIEVESSVEVSPAEQSEVVAVPHIEQQEELDLVVDGHAVDVRRHSDVLKEIIADKKRKREEERARAVGRTVVRSNNPEQEEEVAKVHDNGVTTISSPGAAVAAACAVTNSPVSGSEPAPPVAASRIRTAPFSTGRSARPVSSGGGGSSMSRLMKPTKASLAKQNTNRRGSDVHDLHQSSIASMHSLRTSSERGTSIPAWGRPNSGRPRPNTSTAAARRNAASTGGGSRLTVPQSPNLSTDARLGRRVMGATGAQRTVSEMVADYERTPKRWHSKPKNANRGTPQEPYEPKLTVPVSPHFGVHGDIGHAAAPRDGDAGAREKTLAERVAEFDRTPRRWHSKPATGGPRTPTTEYVPTLTRPVTPVLATASTRSAHGRPLPLSQEESELKYIQNRAPFKARPMNDRVMQSAGQLGVPKIRKSELTKPTGFHFKSEARMQSRRASSAAMAAAKEEAEAAARAKHAAALHQKFSSSVGPTVPQSPCLNTKARGSMRPAPQPKVEVVAEPFKARPMPKGAGFTVKPTRQSLCEPVPFNLRTETRGSQAHAEWEAKVKEDEEHQHQSRLFHARRLPSASTLAASSPRKTQGMVAPSTVPLTEPTPFMLASVERHNMVRAAAEERAEVTAEEEAAAKRFTARPLPRSFFSPYKVRRSDVPVTSPATLMLASDVRAEARANFEAELALRQREAAEAAEEREREKEEEERRETKRLRAAMSFKARPIKQARPLMVKRSEKQLTVPKTPATMRHSSNNTGGEDYGESY